MSHLQNLIYQFAMHTTEAVPHVGLGSHLKNG